MTRLESDLIEAARYREMAASMRKDAEFYREQSENVVIPTDHLGRDYAQGLAARYPTLMHWSLTMADRADSYAADLEAHAAGGVA